MRLSPEAPAAPSWDTRSVKVLIVEDEDAIAEPLAEGLDARASPSSTSRQARRRSGGLRRRPRPARPRPARPRRVQVCRALRAGSRADHHGHRKGEESTAWSASSSVRTTTRQAVRLPRAARPDPRRDGARRRPSTPRRRSVGPLDLTPKPPRAWVGGHAVDLTPKEFDLLALSHTSRVQSCHARAPRGRVAYDLVREPKTIDVHVAALRRNSATPRGSRPCAASAFGCTFPGE